MPRLSVWMIRAALLALALGTALGAVLLAAPGLGGGGLLRWRLLHAELVVVGWTVQLALGVAYWILPRFRQGRERGREELGWAAFVLVNLGVLVAGIGGSVGDGGGWTLAGRGAEVLAALAFAAQAWPRVKPFR
jgi:cbb3-type cytochrome oxidase subunit 1